MFPTCFFKGYNMEAGSLIQESNFFLLPQEIQLHIFSFLREKELILIASVVSKAFAKLAKDDLLWKRFAPRRYVVLFKDSSAREKVIERLKEDAVWLRCARADTYLFYSSYYS